MLFKVYIPARYGSTRLPGKALLMVHGKPIIQHVYDNAIASGAQAVVIATDDNRIAEMATSFGAIVAKTRNTHESGTDRIAEAVSNRDEPADTIIVNVQGDEPLLPGAVMRQVAAILESDSNVDIASVCEPILSERDVNDPNIVKVVRAASQRALYFSRAAVPFLRDSRSMTFSEYRRHVGIYAYRASYLKKFVATPVAELERLEKLEQLRALANDAVISVADAVADCGVGVDTQADYERLLQEWGETQ
ncbi:MAG: 3-deoxy-manno-octulosonate cytidylyltransferase (CMP-KDO synthetase) [Gammaproteobacteria bacterium]|jgi:3-deoxy-manno-octulosonate cytidylyltransferase (CMP-KDO synthetase)